MSASPLQRADFRQRLAGPIPSVSTPFLCDGAIDFEGLRRLIDRGLEAGFGSVVLTYGDSLYSLLTDDEIAETTRVAAEHVGARGTLVAADGMWGLPKEVEFARWCRGLGVDALMALPPDWTASCTIDSLVEYYRAASAEIPIMVVTNYLTHRPHAFGLELLERLRDEAPGVAAVKDDVCGEFARRMSIALHGEMALVAGGQKQNHLNQAPYGVDGYLSLYAKVCPRVARKYWSAVEAEDYRRAAGVVARYDMPMFDRLMKCTGGFDAGVHGLLELAGAGGRWRRKPYHSLSDEELEELGQFAQDLGVL